MEYTEEQRAIIDKQRGEANRAVDEYCDSTFNITRQGECRAMNRVIDRSPELKAAKDKGDIVPYAGSAYYSVRLVWADSLWKKLS